MKRILLIALAFVLALTIAVPPVAKATGDAGLYVRQILVVPSTGREVLMDGAGVLAIDGDVPWLVVRQVVNCDYFEHSNVALQGDIETFTMGARSGAACVYNTRAPLFGMPLAPGQRLTPTVVLMEGGSPVFTSTGELRARSRMYLPLIGGS